MGYYHGGLHHIGINAGNREGVDGHLILAEGAVSGDYYLQENFGILEEEARTTYYSVGSPEYQQHAETLGIMKSPWIYSNKEEVIFPATFKAFTVHDETIPYGAQAYFTPAQADYIFNHSQQQPVYNKTSANNAKYLFKLFKGFYPDINFYLDWTRVMPNIYAFEAFGKKTIVVAGGLTRTEGVTVEGLAIMLSNAISRFYAQQPVNVDGYACVGNADYYGAGVVSRNIWFGDGWFDNTQEGLDATIKLLQLAKDIGGNDSCYDPSIDCRIKALNSGFVGGALPRCAGGPSPILLQLQKASSDTTTINLMFNEGLDAKSAQNIENYELLPRGDIVSATVDPVINFIVHIVTTGLTEGEKYMVQVSNITSAYKTKLDPSHSFKAFTAGKTKKNNREDL